MESSKPDNQAISTYRSQAHFMPFLVKIAPQAHPSNTCPKAGLRHIQMGMPLPLSSRLQMTNLLPCEPLWEEKTSQMSQQLPDMVITVVLADFDVVCLLSDCTLSRLTLKSSKYVFKISCHIVTDPYEFHVKLRHKDRQTSAETQWSLACHAATNLGFAKYLFLLLLGLKGKRSDKDLD